MPKVRLSKLVEGQVFKWYGSSPSHVFEFVLVEQFSTNCTIRNLTNNCERVVKNYYTVEIPPYEDKSTQPTLF